jgi:anthranilate synthase component I
MTISKNEFHMLAKSNTGIVLSKQLVFDTSTPLSVFNRFKSEDNVVFLEGVSTHEQHGRYSYLAIDSHLSIVCEKSTYKIIKDKNETTVSGTVYDALENVLNKYKFPKDTPNFQAGILGNLTYECIEHLENIAITSNRELNTPYAAFMVPKTILVFDRFYHSVTICHSIFLDSATTYTESKLNELYSIGLKKINSVIAKIESPDKIEPTFLLNTINNYDKIDYSCNVSKDKFLDNVKKCLTYIKNGDIFQIQVSRRASIKYSNDPFHLYRYLRNFNPSPLLFNIKLANYQLIGASPEILVNVSNNTMSIRPIAGTRKRYSSTKSEAEIIRELQTDEKEKAEHIMLVDLARNDVGRACACDSVKVNQLMGIEKYAHVIHMVSDVSGTLKPNLTSVDALKYGFPAGTVTGTPKIRAMEIIAELESVHREFYSGGVVFFDFNRNLKTALSIRTICIKDKIAYTQAAGGVVADSIPEMEFKETENKMRSSLSAMAQFGDV